MFYVKKNCKNKWCSVMPVESQLGSLMLENGAFSLRAILLRLGIGFDHFFAAVYIPPQAKENGMPCLLSRQIIKIKTKHPTLQIAFGATGGMNSPPDVEENTKYRGASLKGSFQC